MQKASDQSYGLQVQQIHLQCISWNQGSAIIAEEGRDRLWALGRGQCAHIVSPRNDGEALPMIYQQYGSINKSWRSKPQRDKLTWKGGISY